jgi:hypothetical protein
MPRHWSWEAAPDQYPQLFGEIAAALADRLKASHVLFAANCVDDEELELELRSAGFRVKPPQRKKRWIGSIIRGCGSPARTGLPNEQAVSYPRSAAQRSIRVPVTSRFE